MYDYQVVDSAIIFDQWFRLPEKEKWRKQEVRIILEIPVGQKIYCHRDLSGILDYKYGRMPFRLIGKTLIMTDGGLEIYVESEELGALSEPLRKSGIKGILVSNPQF